jgi:hypothetical protein
VLGLGARRPEPVGGASVQVAGLAVGSHVRRHSGQVVAEVAGEGGDPLRCALVLYCGVGPPRPRRPKARPEIGEPALGVRRELLDLLELRELPLGVVQVAPQRPEAEESLATPCLAARGVNTRLEALLLGEALLLRAQEFRVRAGRPARRRGGLPLLGELLEQRRDDLLPAARLEQGVRALADLGDHLACGATRTDDPSREDAARAPSSLSDSKDCSSVRLKAKTLRKSRVSAEPSARRRSSAVPSPRGVTIRTPPPRAPRSRSGVQGSPSTSTKSRPPWRPPRSGS